MTRSGGADNQPLLWTGPRREWYSLLIWRLSARRVARHRTSSVMQQEGMSDWRTLISKLVEARGTQQFPLLVYEVRPPSGGPWPPGFPTCKGIRDFYSRCDGGLLSIQYDWLAIAKVEAETSRWRELLNDYHGDGQPVLLPGRHVVLATDSGGAPVIWDGVGDQMATFFWKGGDWEPMNLNFEDFMSALFLNPERVDAGDMWPEALTQL